MLEQFGREWHIPQNGVSERAILLGTYLGEPITLDVRNTYIRIFGEGDEHIANQVIHTLPSEKVLPLWLHDEGLARFKDELMGGDFPVYHSNMPEREVVNWLATEIIPNYLNFPEPEEEAIEKILDDIQVHNRDSDYSISDMRRDATSIATLDSASASGWLQRPRRVRLKGVTIYNLPHDTENPT